MLNLNIRSLSFIGKKRRLVLVTFTDDQIQDFWNVPYCPYWF